MTSLANRVVDFAHQALTAARQALLDCNRPGAAQQAFDAITLIDLASQIGEFEITRDPSVLDTTKRQMQADAVEFAELLTLLQAQFSTIRPAHPAGIAAWARAVIEQQRETLDLIDLLRSEEADSVTINCDNPDFDGMPNCAIDCNGDWTGYVEKRFGGDTVLHALRAAAAARRLKVAGPSL